MGLRAGIDLGTTNSVIYVVVDDQLVLVCDRHRSATVPSVVWQAPGKDALVGRTAKGRMGFAPPPIIEVKRLMGTDARVDLGGRQLTPIEVSAIILKHLKEAAEAVVREKHPSVEPTITEVVVTHPARFGARARQDTARAAELAGFTRVELLAEPIAAALAYAQRAIASEAGAPSDQRIVAYDLGGGTFDVTVLERRGNQVSVLEYGGDEHLGGSNFDKRLALYLQKHLTEQGYDFAIDHEDQNDAPLWHRLKAEAEGIKIELTGTDPVVRSTPSFAKDKSGEDVELAFTIGRQDFNALTEDLMDRTIRLTHRLLAKQPFADGKKLGDEELEPLGDEGVRARSRANAQHAEIILVGSSCWMPIVRERLREELGRDCKLVDPAVIIAEGAGIKAMGLSGSSGEGDWRETRNAEIEIRFAPPTLSPRRRVTLSGQVRGPAAGACTVILADREREEAKGLEGRPAFTFERDLAANEENDFTLTLSDGGGDDVFEESFTIRHTSEGVTPPDETLAVPILVQTRSGFAPLFAAYKKLPLSESLTLRTADDSGTVRIPFYEGDCFIDEIRIPEAPRRKGELVRLEATIDKKYRISASAEVGGVKVPVEFEIKARELRGIEAMLEEARVLRQRFENAEPAVTDPNRKLRLRNEWRRVWQQLHRTLEEERPELVHAETLVASLRKLNDEASLLPQLKPTWEEINAELDTKRPYAPSTEAIQELDTLLRDAKQAYEAQDAERWRLLVDRCRALTEMWRPAAPPPGPTREPTPAEVKAIGLRFLFEAQADVKKWGKHAADRRDKLLKDLATAYDEVERAPLERAIELYARVVLPLQHRVAEGPGEPIGDGLTEAAE